MHQYFSVSLFDSRLYQWRRFACDSLITLTMIVSTYIKEHMIFTVVPFDQFVLILITALINAVRTVCNVEVLLDLSQQPTAGDYGVSHQQCFGSCCTHL